MSTATQSIDHGQIVDPAEVRRGRTMGIFYVLIGVCIYWLFVPSSQPGQTAILGLNPGTQSAALTIPDLVMPVRGSLYAMALVSIVLGVIQLVRGFKRFEGLVLGVVALFLVMSFVVWAARGTGFNMLGVLASTLQRAMPIVLAALSGVMCERSGIINIAIEGMMLMAAMTSALFGSITGSLWLGLIISLLFAGLLGWLLAVLSIRYKINQVISGTAINILSTGLTSFISAKFMSENAALNNSGKFTNVAIPLLSRIPIIGPIFFETNVIVYMMYILLIVMHVMLYYTRWGLRTRAIGEHPRAADTLGVDVLRMRYINVIIGGMVAGLGGAFLVLGSVPRFDELMTAGKGFIGLAAMIFGKWNPFGAFGASLIFGFADALQGKLQILEVPIPSQFMRMAPYLITMIVLAGVVGRSEAPAAEGEPYEKQ